MFTICNNPILQLQALLINKSIGNIVKIAQKQCHIYNELS
jgi:hypothetical protein